MTEFGEELKCGAFTDTHPSVEKRYTEFNLWNFSTKFASDKSANSGPKCLFILIESFQRGKPWLLLKVTPIITMIVIEPFRSQSGSFMCRKVNAFFKKKKRKIKIIRNGFQRYERKGVGAWWI